MITPSTTQLPDGRVIQYLDVIHHHTDTKFDFMDRIRILFRGRSRIHSEIYTGEICNVKGSKATVYVVPVFKKKDKIMGLQAPKMEVTDAVQS